MSNDEIDPEGFAKRVLEGIRMSVERAGIDENKLPRWVSAADIKIVRINNSALIYFEPSPKEYDKILESEQVSVDVEFYFPNFEEGINSSVISTCADDEKAAMPALIRFSPTTDELGLNLIDNCELRAYEYNAVTDVGLFSYHRPLLLYHDVIHRIRTTKQGEETIAVRYVPFCLYVHKNDLADFDKFWSTLL